MASSTFRNHLFSMKTNYVLSLVCLLTWSTTVLAQSAAPPKEEYNLLASATTIAVARGKQDSIKLSVIRSRSFRTGEATMVLTPPSEAGLSASITPIPGRADEYILYLS